MYLEVNIVLYLELNNDKFRSTNGADFSSYKNKIVFPCDKLFVLLLPWQNLFDPRNGNGW